MAVQMMKGITIGSMGEAFLTSVREYLVMCLRML